MIDVYELDLPSNLPPSYRGRTLRLSYEFILGICRASDSSVAGAGSHSRVMKVPIRLYNNVVGESSMSQLFVDLINYVVLSWPPTHTVRLVVACNIPRWSTTTSSARGGYSDRVA